MNNYNNLKYFLQKLLEKYPKKSLDVVYPMFNVAHLAFDLLIDLDYSKDLNSIITYISEDIENIPKLTIGFIITILKEVSNKFNLEFDEEEANNFAPYENLDIAEAYRPNYAEDTIKSFYSVEDMTDEELEQVKAYMELVDHLYETIEIYIPGMLNQRPELQEDAKTVLLSLLKDPTNPLSTTPEEMAVIAFKLAYKYGAELSQEALDLLKGTPYELPDDIYEEGIIQ